MPELPEVQTIVTGLDRSLRGAVIAAVDVARWDVVHEGRRTLASGLPEQRIERIDREGKRIICHLAGGCELVFHLGMSGRLTLVEQNVPALPHTHLRIRFQGRGDELRFRDPRRFGGVWFIETTSASLSRLGPDALSIRVPVLRQALRRRRQIKALLLDQQAISGLGNIYCDEALFSAGIHPLQPAAMLSHPQIKRLACSIRKTLRASIDSGGSTLNDYRQADGSEGAFQKLLRVYGRDGQGCRRCGTKIVRILAAGRSTHVCPKCQRMSKQGRTSPKHGHACA